MLPDDLVGPAVDRAGFRDAELRRQVDRLHRALGRAGDSFEAESWLALVRERLVEHLRRRPARTTPAPTSGLAGALRDLLDAHVADGLSLRDAAAALDAHPTHLVRAFTRRFGLPPHRYLTGRRIDLARTQLLAGRPVADVAIAVGFYDQAHLTRHFRRYLGVGPARFADRPSDLNGSRPTWPSSMIKVR